MLRLAVPSSFFKCFKLEESPLKILIGTSFDVTEISLLTPHFKKKLESILTKIKRGSFQNPVTFIAKNSVGIL